MRKAFVVGSVALLGLSAQAFAEEGFSYTYLDFGYVTSEFDDTDADGDGYGLFGSFELTERLHGFIGYSDQDVDFSAVGQRFEVSAEQLEIGAGLALPISANLDIVPTVSYIKVEADGPLGSSFDDDGLGVGLSLRGRVAGQLELTGGFDYVNFDDGGDDTSFGVGARYFFNDRFALGADATFDDDVTTFFLGGRVNF